MTDKPDQVLVDITIAAPVDEVWAALRDPRQIANWFGWDADTLADEITFIFATHATELPGPVLQFGEWEGSADRFELSAENGGTRLRVVRSGGAPIDWDGVYEDITQGWITFAQQLRLALEQHRGEMRRTIFLSGAAKPGAGEPSAALGLDRHIKIGQPYSAMLTSGDHVSGTVWHATTFQTGFSVEQWGDGLLVVTDKGVSESRPHGGGSVILTTYGLSEPAFAELEGRWKAWWAERYT